MNMRSPLHAAIGAALALVCLASGCISGPQPITEEAKKRNARGVDAMNAGNWDLAIKEFELALKLSPRFVQARANLGLACHRRGFSDRGIKELKAANADADDQGFVLGEVFNHLGVIYTDRGNFKDAEYWLKKGIELTPSYEDLYYNLGMLYLKMGKDADALRAFVQCTKLANTHTPAHLQAGWLYFKNGVYQDAEQHAELAEPDPKKPNASAQALKGWIMLRKERYGEAIRTFNLALRLDKNEGNAKSGLLEARKKAPKRVARELAKEAKELYDKETVEAKEEATQLLYSAEAIDPNLPDVHIIRAQIYLDKKSYKNAEREAKEALALDKGNRDARLILGVIDMLQQDWKSAETHIYALRKEQPNVPKFHLYLGTIYHMQKKHRKAEREWKEAAKCTKPAPGKHMMQQILANLAELEKTPSFKKANELNAQGAQLLAKRDLEGAADKFKQALELDPEFAFSACNAALVAIERGDLAYAKKMAEQALALDDDIPQAHNNLGIVLLKQEKYKEAEARFRRAAELDRSYADPHLNLGILYFVQQKYAEAETAIEAAIETDPNLARAHVALAELYMKRQPPLYGKAEARLKMAIDIDPKYAGAHFMLGRLFALQNRHDEAMKKFEDTYQLNKDDPSPWIAWGDSALAKGDRSLAFGAYLQARDIFKARGTHKEAADCSRKAVDLNPQSAEAHRMLGEDLGDIGLLSDAVTELRRAIELNDQDLYAQYVLGIVYEKQQDKRRAAEAWRVVYQRNPNNTDVIAKLLSVYEDGDTGPVSLREAIELGEQALRVEKDPARRRIFEEFLSQLRSKRK